MYLVSLLFYELVFLCVLGQILHSGTMQKVMLVEHLGAFMFFSADVLGT